MVIMAGKKNKANKTSSSIVRQVQSAVDSAVAKLNQQPTGTKKTRKRRQGANAQVAIGMGSVTTNSVQYNGSTNCVIRNTEYVSDVTWDGSTTGPVISIDINPAAGTFSWLGRIASCYDLFRIRSLTFTYTPTCSTQTPGVVVMAFDYDSSDSPPGSKLQMSGFGAAKRGNVWNELKISMASSGGWRYVGQIGAAAINPPNTDIKLYDVAKFYLGVYNMSSGATVGDLSVTYDIEFAKPELGAAPPAYGEYIQLTGTTITNPAGSSSTLTGNLPVTLSSVTNGTNYGLRMIFPKAGPFLITFLNSLRHPSTAAIPWSSAEYIPYPGYVGAPTSVVNVAETVGTWVNSGTDYYDTSNFMVNAGAGSVVTFWILASLTKFFINNLRISTYPTLQ